MAEHQNDEISLLRVINIPSRGIGITTINHLKDYSINKQSPLYKVLHKIEEIKIIGSYDVNREKIGKTIYDMYKCEKCNRTVAKIR